MDLKAFERELLLALKSIHQVKLYEEFTRELSEIIPKEITRVTVVWAGKVMCQIKFFEPGKGPVDVSHDVFKVVFDLVYRQKFDGLGVLAVWHREVGPSLYTNNLVKYLAKNNHIWGTLIMRDCDPEFIVGPSEAFAKFITKVMKDNAIERFDDEIPLECYNDPRLWADVVENEGADYYTLKAEWNE